jgi:hypothetical protein
LSEAIREKDKATLTGDLGPVVEKKCCHYNLVLIYIDFKSFSGLNTKIDLMPR